MYHDSDHSLAGKTSQHTDTVQGRFVELIPDTKILEVVEFESQKPEFAGEMKIIVSLADVDGGTEVTMHCQDIPLGIRPEDNEQGCKESRTKASSCCSNDSVCQTAKCVTAHKRDSLTGS